MCLVQLLLTSFLQKDIKDSLSVKIRIGLNIMLKSFLSFDSQVPSTELKEPAITSASIIEQETMFCFFEDQHIGALEYV